MERRLRRWRVWVRTRKIESFSLYSSCINCTRTNEIVTDVCWLRNKPFNSRAFCMALTNDRRITEAQQIRTTCISQFSQCRDACRDSPFKQIDSDLRLCRVNSIVLAAKLFWLYRKTIRSLSPSLPLSARRSDTFAMCSSLAAARNALSKKQKRYVSFNDNLRHVFVLHSFHLSQIRRLSAVSCLSSICRVCAHCTGGQHL